MTDLWKGTRYEGTQTVRVVLPRHVVGAVEKAAREQNERYSAIVTKALVNYFVLIRTPRASNESCRMQNEATT